MTTQDFYLTLECTVKNTLTAESVFDLSESLESVFGSVSASPGTKQFSASITVNKGDMLAALSMAQYKLTSAAGKCRLIDLYNEITFDTVELRTAPAFHAQQSGQDAPPPLTMESPVVDAVAMALCADFYTTFHGTSVDPVEAWGNAVGTEREGFLRDALVAAQTVQAHHDNA